MRRTAAESLGKIGDTMAEPFLVGALDDSDPVVREAAARALGQLPSFGESSVHGLAALLEDADASVRRAAAVALGQAGDAQTAVDSLIRLLASSDAALRRSATHALLYVEASNRLAVEALSQRTKDADPAVRQWAIAALAETGDPRAVQVVVDRLVRDESEAVRAEAAYRLGFIGDRSVSRDLKLVAEGDASTAVRRWAAASRFSLMDESGSGSGPQPDPPAETGPCRRYP